MLLRQNVPYLLSIFMMWQWKGDKRKRTKNLYKRELLKSAIAIFVKIQIQNLRAWINFSIWSLSQITRYLLEIAFYLNAQTNQMVCKFVPYLPEIIKALISIGLLSPHKINTFSFQTYRSSFCYSRFKNVSSFPPPKFARTKENSKCSHCICTKVQTTCTVSRVFFTMCWLDCSSIADALSVCATSRQAPKKRRCLSTAMIRLSGRNRGVSDRLIGEQARNFAAALAGARG